MTNPPTQSHPSRSIAAGVAILTCLWGLLLPFSPASSHASATSESTMQTNPQDNSPEQPTTRPSGRPADLAEGAWEVGQLLHDVTFDKADAIDQWAPELEKGGTVAIEDGKLVIDVPGGCTAWFKAELERPLLIEYDVTVIDAGGANDRVSDLNCFWMARDARNPDDIFAVERSGTFFDYNQLRCYYVGLGGNTNSTTRFRRYIGDQERRPLLPEHDLEAEQYLIKPNVKQTIRLIAADGRTEYWRDDTRIFDYDDPEPYRVGWFAFRTVTNHLEIDRFQVYRLEKRQAEADEKNSRKNSAAVRRQRPPGAPRVEERGGEESRRAIPVGRIDYRGSPYDH